MFSVGDKVTTIGDDRKGVVIESDPYEKMARVIVHPIPGGACKMVKQWFSFDRLRAYNGVISWKSSRWLRSCILRRKFERLQQERR